jgi:hypothetical protein
MNKEIKQKTIIMKEQKLFDETCNAFRETVNAIATQTTIMYDKGIPCYVAVIFYTEK